ncbi:MAG TPA: TylF/MycF/NovP-related O-methyltransferase [Bryobacteraceae bacterium]|nr:TylF/MycF/NovP-related O-methyltransferase [Bryobacteraceae bacterium]
MSARGNVTERLMGVLKHPSIRAGRSFYLWRCGFSFTPREEILDLAMQFAAQSKLEGDYLEFGVFRGDTFAMAFHMARRWGLNNSHFYAFDSFQGLPATAGVDVMGFEQFKEGEMGCTERAFLDNLRRRKVDRARVTTIPGWFHETLTRDLQSRLPIQRASVVWIDCDLHASTVPVLEFLTPYLQTGTVIIFDDWFCYRGDPQRGQQRAWSDWRSTHPWINAVEWHKVGWHGQALIAHCGPGDRTEGREQPTAQTPVPAGQEPSRVRAEHGRSYGHLLHPI